ncbi:MAG: adenine phosphoribosyltransferase [Anaerolineae bacterium]|nr:adenine phosphoribosyltransferase [Anaerolineales bacterium]MCQ3971885.1 adenine phosphoribosyltransferase [Anaerolineae bacterium]
MDLAATIRSVPDFPIAGILFYDITTLLKNPVALKESIDRLTAQYQNAGVDMVVGIESRGFIFGIPLAYNLGVGFVPVRKPGKLPAETIAESYALEYGTNTLEVHVDAIEKGQKVLIVDDLLATGGTAKATCGLVEKLGGQVVGLAFAIELTFLNGRDVLKGYNVFSLLQYDA